MLFEKVIADVKPFDLSMIRESVAHIEAEMKSSVVLWDEQTLKKQLALCQKAFISHQNLSLHQNRLPKNHRWKLIISRRIL